MDEVSEGLTHGSGEQTALGFAAVNMPSIQESERDPVALYPSWQEGMHAEPDNVGDGQEACEYMVVIESAGRGQ